MVSANSSHDLVSRVRRYLNFRRLIADTASWSITQQSHSKSSCYGDWEICIRLLSLRAEIGGPPCGSVPDGEAGVAEIAAEFGQPQTFAHDLGCASGLLQRRLDHR